MQQPEKANLDRSTVALLLAEAQMTPPFGTNTNGFISWDELVEIGTGPNYEKSPVSRRFQ
jgi:hypothetical protein